MADPQIIIVEDELIIAQEIKQFLIKMGYAVPETASSGEDALKKIANIKPDLVLMDIKLKGEMNGIEIAGKAHALYDIPIVYMTANADKDTVERAKKTEAYGFVYKPVQPDVLRAVIEMALYKHDMEKKVKEREAWLDATLQSIGDAVIATDIQGNITFMNSVAELLIGWKQEECKSKPLQSVFNIINKTTRKPISNPVTDVLQQGTQVGLGNNTVLISRDGKEYQIADSASPIHNNRGEAIGVVLVFRDVTKEYQMREEIIQNEQKYRNLFDFISSVVGVYEAVENGNDFIFKDINRAGEIIENVKKEQFLGRRLKEIFPDIVESGLFDVIYKVWKTGKPQQYVVNIYKNKKLFNIRDTYVYKLQSGEIVAVYNDITERTLADQRLQASEENLRITLNSIGDAVIATDTQGKITRMNPVAEELTGWDFSDAKGKPLHRVFNIINSSTRKRVENPVLKVMETGKIVGLANHTTLIAKNGQEYQVADSGAPIKDSEGKITGVVLVFRDVTKEYQLQEEIIKSTQKYADIFNSSFNGIALHKIVLDNKGKPVDYIFLEANAAFEKLTGLKVKDIIGKKVTEVIPGIENTTFIPTYGQVALTGNSISFEQFAPVIDRYYLINAFSPQKGYFATIFNDITLNKQAEQQLLTERRRLTDILKGTNVGTWEWNVQTGETVFDEHWSDMLGYSLEELSPVSFNTWKALIHPHDLPKAIEALEKHFNKETDFYECETRLLHKNGNWIWILDRGKVSTWTEDRKPLLMFGTHQDITERKRNEEALYVNEAIFSSFLEHSPVYVFFKDQEIRSIRLSRNYEQLLGIPIKDALGKTMDDLFPSDLAKCMIEDDKQVLNEGKCVEVVEEFNGRVYETTKFPILKDGNPFMLAGFTLDITERKKAEEQVRKNLQEKEVMLKEIHHRVKNNMNVITSLLHLQSKRIETKEQAQAAFEESRNRIFSMALVHEQLYKSDDFSKIDMKNYIESISQQLKQTSSIDKHITTELMVNNIFLDVTQAIPCGLILNELITNIYKHAFTKLPNGRIFISFQSNNKTYELIVQDNGTGLPENINFNNVNTLGLQLVKLLTEQIGGTLQVQRKSGTIFTIRFNAMNGQE